MSIISAFPTPELFLHCAEYLQVADIGHFTRVSKYWKGLLEDQSLWKSLSQ